MSYVKQNWKTGDTITATKMNNMDNAISVNDSAISILNENKLNKPTNTGTEGQVIVKGTGDTICYEDMPTTIENADVANKAISDKNGLQIDTNYLKLTGGEVNGNIYVTGQNYLRLKTGSKDATDGCGLALNNKNSSVALLDWSLSGQGVIIYHAGDVYATTKTPPANDNSDKIVTTNFVKNQSSSMQVSALDTDNTYWVKEPSGLITQFIEIEATTEEIEVPLLISFPNKCLFVDVDVLNQEKDTSMDVKFNTIEKGLNSVKLLKIGTGTPKITVRVQGV